MALSRQDKISILQKMKSGNLTRQEKVQILKNMRGGSLSEPSQVSPEITPPPQPQPLSFEMEAQRPQRLGAQSDRIEGTEGLAEKRPDLRRVTQAERSLLPSLTEGKMTPMKLATAPLEFAGAGARALGAVSEKTGVSDVLRSTLGEPKPKGIEEKSFSQLMEDPDIGVLQPVRQRVERATEDLPGAARVPLRLATGIATGIAEDPSTALSLGAGAIKKGVSGIVPKRPLGVPKEALQETSQGFRFTPSQITEQATGPRANIEQFAQINPFTRDIPGKIAEGNIEAVQKTVGRQAEKIGADVPTRPRDVDVRGEVITRTFQESKEAAGKAFREGEEKLGEVARTAAEKALKSKALPKGEISVSKNATGKIDEHLSEVGFKEGKPRSAGMDPKVIKKVQDFKDELSNVDDISELIKNKQSFADEVFGEAKQGMWKGRAQKFLEDVNKKMNEAIESSITDVLGKDGEEVVKVYRDMNKQYSSVLDATKQVGKKLRIEGAPQNITAQISKLDPKDIKKLKDSKDKSLKAIHSELSRGAYEDIIAKSLAKDGSISPDKFVSQWNKVPGMVKEELFDKQMINEMDLLAKNINKASFNDLMKVNPSGTGRAVTLSNFFTNPKDAAMAMIHGVAIRHYYKTGKLFRESALNLTRDASGAVFNTADNLKKLRKIQSGRVSAQELTRREDDDKER